MYVQGASKTEPIKMICLICLTNVIVCPDFEFKLVEALVPDYACTATIKNIWFVCMYVYICIYFTVTIYIYICLYTMYLL